MAPTNLSPSPADVVKKFLACVETKDIECMRNLIHDQATACLIRGDEPRFQTLSEAITTLAKTQQDIREVIFDEVEHRDASTSGEFATVWTKFEIYMDGKASTTD